MAQYLTHNGSEPIERDFLCAELSGLRAGLRKEMSSLESRLVDRIDSEFNQMIPANLATLVAYGAMIITAIKL